MATPALVLSIVLVHGAWADGSGWQQVHDILQKDGYTVNIVQNPTITLEEDVAYAKRVIDMQPGKVLLVGHSYGGVVITEAGNDPKVAGLVYVAAFAPDAGESVAKLGANPPPGAALPPVLPPADGFLRLDAAKFPASFAADVRPSVANFMAVSQVPWGVAAYSGEVTSPAWKTKPSWYMIAKDDKMIPPPAQQAMSKRAGAKVTEISASHALYISHPKEVAQFIEKAARSIEQ
jgi:pimeloyl-ACP methyl ester carboxylesterase